MREGNSLKVDRVACRHFENEPASTEICKAEEAGNTPATAAWNARGRDLERPRRRLIVGAMAALLLMLGIFIAPSSSFAEVAVGISVSFGPPALPVYAQPPCPGPGYIWTPGYWGWDPSYGYYWVPGTWVPAPFVGALWTPGYWGFSGGLYYWHPGYWGPRVGYYGGIVYGYGYTGYGYHGGYWDHDRFFYNRAVNNIRINNIRYYYTRRVEDVRFTRVSYNGGPGGVNARPTRDQLAAFRERRFGPLDRQREHARAARIDPAQRATLNHGRPGIAATSRPGDFRGRGIVRATRAGAPYRAPARAMSRDRRQVRSAPVRSYNSRGREQFPATAPPRRSEPAARGGRSMPRGREFARPVERRNAPRAERYNQNRGRAQAQRGPERRAAHERPGRPDHPGNGHGPGGHFR